MRGKPVTCKTQKEAYARFRSIYEPSRIFSSIANLTLETPDTQRLRFVGEGTKARTYLWQNGDNRLVIKLGHDYFDENFPVSFTPEWEKTVLTVADGGVPMIPPIATLHVNGSIALVTLPLSDILQGVPDRKLGEHIDSMEREMNRRHVRNRDTLHIGFYDEVPFVADLSDFEKVD